MEFPLKPISQRQILRESNESIPSSPSTSKGNGKRQSIHRKENASDVANSPAPSPNIRSVRKVASARNSVSSYGTPSRPRRSSSVRDFESPQSNYRSPRPGTTPSTRGRQERSSSLPTSLVPATPTRRSSVRGRTSSMGGSSSSKPPRTGDAVRVVVRIRPSNDESPNTEDGGKVYKLGTISYSSENDQVLTLGGNFATSSDDVPQQAFTFDKVLSPTVAQSDVFAQVGKPITNYALQGINASIFAYGQTGSGKTFTMEGDRSSETDRGLIPRVLEHLFLSLEAKVQAQPKTEYTVQCTYTEIYNEDVYDLLDTPKEGTTLKRKLIREDTKRGIFVEGLVSRNVQCTKEALMALEEGSKLRRVGETKMNHVSSRSHSIFSLNIRVVERLPGNEGIAVTKTSKINLVDLAGSERQQQTQSDGQRLREAKHINRSLSALGNVISALVDRCQGKGRYHIPHRDSALTFLLKDSLGGNTKTVIVATVSPNESNYQDTLSSLKFGKRAKAIKNMVEINTDLSGSLEAYKQEVKTLTAKLVYYREQEKKWLKKKFEEHGDNPRAEEANELPAPPVIDSRMDQAGQTTLPQRAETTIRERLANDPNYKRISALVDGDLGEKSDPSSQTESALITVLTELQKSQEELTRRDKAIETFREAQVVLEDALKTRQVVSNVKSQVAEDRKPATDSDQGESAKIALLQSENDYFRLILESFGIPPTLFKDKAARRLSGEMLGDQVDDGTQQAITQHVMHELQEGKRSNNLLRLQLEKICKEKVELKNALADVKLESEKQQECMNRMINEAMINDMPQVLEGAQGKEESKDNMLKRIEELQDTVFQERERYEKLKAKLKSFDTELDGGKNQRKRFSLGDPHPKEAILKEVEAVALHSSTPRRLSASPTGAHGTQTPTNMEKTRVKLDFELQKQTLTTSKQLTDERKQSESSPRSDDDLATWEQKPTTMLGYRKQNHALLMQNQRLKLQIENMEQRLKSERRLSRKSISTCEQLSSKDQQEMLAVQLENDKLRHSNEQLSLTNKELTDAVDEQQKFADFKAAKLRQELVHAQSEYQTLQVENAELKRKLEMFKRDSNAAVAAMNMMSSRKSLGNDISNSKSPQKPRVRDEKGRSTPVGVAIVARESGPVEVDEVESELPKTAPALARHAPKTASPSIASAAEVAAAVRKVAKNRLSKSALEDAPLAEVLGMGEEECAKLSQSSTPAIVRRTFVSSIVTGETQTTSRPVAASNTPNSLLKGSFRIKSKTSVAELFPSTPSKETEDAKRLATEKLMSQRESATTSKSKGWSSLLKFSR